ncbi:TPA: phosphate ABC transporter permease PstA [Methanosarcina acetivorans]|nr:phosphate ABC transporter permease PstA [Methanosarcina acetivorans]
MGISYFSAATVVLVLLFIIGIIAIKGIPSLTPEFVFSSESQVFGFGGAIGNAIVGTILLSTLSPLLAIPFAIGTAIYLKRYAKEGFFTSSLSFLLEVLSGTPSIVLGLFGFLFLAIQMKYFTGGFSLISGTIALAILVLPVMEKATENALDSVPLELEDASYALGATKWETISKISLPYAILGIITGILLSIGRAAEESAVVVLTAGYSQFFPEWKVVPNDKFIFGVKIYPFQDLVAALPITVYHGFEFPNMVSPSESFGAAFVLILIVMLINFTTRMFLRRRKIG